MERALKHAMGNRLRARAGALDLGDGEAARLVNISQPPYANHVNDAIGSALGTLVRICRALAAARVLLSLGPFHRETFGATC